jgi:hypothetical protein
MQAGKIMAVVSLITVSFYIQALPDIPPMLLKGDDVTIRYQLLAVCVLFTGYVRAEPVTYYCNIYTHLRGGPESSVFRFEVNDSHAVLSYTYRVGPDQKPEKFEVLLDVLNDSNRSLVLGALTEGNEQHAPRYDVWVLDKNNMHLSSEVTRSSDVPGGRIEQRTGAMVRDRASLACAGHGGAPSAADLRHTGQVAGLGGSFSDGSHNISITHK